MKPFTKYALALGALALTTAAGGAAVRAADPMTTTKLVFKPITRHAARRTLIGRNRSRHEPQRGRFTRADIDRLIAQAWAAYDREAASLPPQPTLGSRLNLRLACLTVGLFRALLDAGTERAYAVDLVSDTTWSVYRYWGLPAKLRARLHPDAVFTRASRLIPCRSASHSTHPATWRNPCPSQTG